MRSFSLSFSDELAPYDAIESVVSTALSVADVSPVDDPDAAALSRSYVVVRGEIVSQCI